jgi:hypothetical protein
VTLNRLEVGNDRGCRALKAVTKHRSRRVQLERQVAQEFIAGESLLALATQHDVPRNLIRLRAPKCEAGVR